MLFTVTPQELLDALNAKVVGQDDAKKSLAMAVAKHVNSIQDKGKGVNKHLIIIGNSGCGKTYMVRVIAEYLKSKQIQAGMLHHLFPLLEIDCTQVTPSGYVGQDFMGILSKHKKLLGSRLKLENTPKRLTRVFFTSIVFLDEIDKLCMEVGGDSAMNKQTQYSLLKILEDYGNHMLFILAGNFAQLRHNRKNTKKTIGFTTEKDNEGDRDLYLELEEAGLATQILGRVPSATEIGELGREELYAILDNHLLPEFRKTAKLFGIRMRLTKKVKDNIVDETIKRKLGARGLQVRLHEILKERTFKDN